MWKHLAGMLALCGVAVCAQTPPKLALAGVTVTPTLAGRLASSPPALASVAPSANADVLGKWAAAPGGGKHPWTVTIKQSPDGSLHALFENHEMNYSCVSTSVARTGNHLRMTFFNDKVKYHNVNTVEGEVNGVFGILQGVWNWHDAQGKPHSANFTFHRRAGSAETVAESAPGSAPPPAISLENLTHFIDVQLFDRFKGEPLFSLMGDADLKKAIAPTDAPNTPYDLSKPDTAARFKQAGVNYLLITSVEDFSDQTIEKRRTKDLHYQRRIYNRASTRDVRFGRKGVSSGSTDSGAEAATQGGLDPEVWQQQTIRLTVRCQLFDTTSGELKKSTTATFPFQRDYTAVAQGKNEISTADLCEAAARNVSVWATALVDDAIFPIKVLAKNDREVTISRGSEAGLKVTQVFEVRIQGDAIKDPDTGKFLGYDVKTVGYVEIAELEPKFSHAKVLEDNGIVPGATLARTRP